MLNRKTIVLVDTAEINGVKAFKGKLTYSYIFIGKHEFFSLPSSEIENMDFKFSDKYTVYFTPILGVIGMVGVGYENNSFYLDSLKTNCE
ncbi:MAG TPA: hypothetical protein VEC12_02245 [Bacteroidia bacterium]|nr:hypothetical protein [Bacteroidia bacterium]